MHHFLAFELSESVFAVPLEEVHSIVHLPALSRPPGMPVLLEGFLNLRGKVVPVVRLDRLFELPEKGLGPYTILLVEDEDSVRELARRVLERSGYRVLLARNGNEALEVCGSHRGPVHLMLTDITMPQMSGPELAREAASRFPGLKIAYISGCSEANTKELPGPYGDLLGKPFTAEALIAKVREVLDRDD